MVTNIKKVKYSRLNGASVTPTSEVFTTVILVLPITDGSQLKIMKATQQKCDIYKKVNVNSPIPSN
jgi:hypothetical protein